jgi:hypothetical protein
LKLGFRLIYHIETGCRSGSAWRAVALA